MAWVVGGNTIGSNGLHRWGSSPPQLLTYLMAHYHGVGRSRGGGGLRPRVCAAAGSVCPSQIACASITHDAPTDLQVRSIEQARDLNPKAWRSVACVAWGRHTVWRSYCVALGSSVSVISVMSLKLIVSSKGSAIVTLRSRCPIARMQPNP